ncbi:MAG: Rpn family recombination-promoting nuclease/putative transposase [Cyanobacteria bacterium SBLK]|nr:Rpn family recombination-promoting nuclease/putative transposase [Cyanobacteria bacterium SBLK]
MKTDILFYELIKQLPNFFFEIIGQTDIDGNIYSFSAPEVKQQSFRLDGLLVPPDEAIDSPLYFIELQTYKDEEFYDRFFGEIFVYFRQYRPPQTHWYAVVVYDRRSREVLPHPRYRVLTENHLLRVYLDELEDEDNDSLAIEIARLLIKSPQEALSRGRVLIERVRSEESDDKFNRTVLALIQGIIFYKFPSLTLAELETMLDLGNFRQTRLYQSIVEQTRQEMLDSDEFRQTSLYQSIVEQTRQEMLDSDEFRQTSLYQSIVEQTRQEMSQQIQEQEEQVKVEAVPKLLKTGLSVQQVSECLNLNLEIVKKIAREQQL